jgi:hypothetical protein
VPSGVEAAFGEGAGTGEPPASLRRKVNIVLRCIIADRRYVTRDGYSVNDVTKNQHRVL